MTPAYDRWLLLGEKRDALLTLAEVERYGRENFGDPDYLSLYGRRPTDWYARGVRIAGRTAVECTRDRLADAIGRDIAAVTAGSALAVDLFAGSANTLYWIKRHTGARLAVGFELNDTVFRLTRTNLALVHAGIGLIHDSYDQGLPALEAPAGPLIVFITPPWGRALDDNGLDLARTRPPVAEVVDFAASALSGHDLLYAVQVFEKMEPTALDTLTSMFDWSQMMIYNFNAPGQNSGLLLGTSGWAPR